ncbi:MAG: YIP1 family protein [Anaerolineaceae bacterium]
MNFKWIPPLFLRPVKTIGEIVAQEKPVWLTPLLILSVLTLMVVLIAAPIQRTQSQMGAELPPDFQYYSPEMQDQYYQAQANQTSPLFLYVFPMLSGLLKIWVPWFLLSVILYLSLTLAGSRASSTRSYNLVSWSMLPIAIRMLVQIAVMLFSRSLVSAPGLAGFIESEASGAGAYFRSLLAFIDFYFLWQVFLLIVGAVQLSSLTRTKAVVATLISVVILLFLSAIPGLFSSALSGLSIRGGFYF